MQAGRSDEQELMDNPSVTYSDLEKALHELGQINRWLGGHRTTRIGVGRLTETLPDHRAVTVLDLAAGGTDLTSVLQPLHRPFRVAALDINPLMAEYARRHCFEVDSVIASALELSYPDRSFDIVHVALFLHHCTDAQIVDLLQQAVRIARVGVVVNELQRHPLALSGISLLTALFSRSPIVRNDASVSVRRGFTRRELQALLSRARIAESTLTWQWAFRWCLSIHPERTNGNE